MKLASLLFIISFFLSAPSQGSVIIPVKGSNQSFRLIAKKGTKVKKYAIGSSLHIKMRNSKSYSGSIFSLTSDSVYLQLHKKKVMAIAVGDIHSVQKVNNVIKTWLPYTIIMIVLTGIGLLLLPTNFLSVAFLALPVVSLFTYYPILLAIIIAGIVGKKSIAKGWEFYTEKK